MAAKTTPLPIKVAIYQRVISGDLTRMVARAYHLSQPTAVKYANDAIDNLRLLPEVEANEDLVGFLAKPLKFQAYQYPDDENIQALMAPILAPFLEQADKIAYTDRESADQPLSTRVSRTVEEKFQQKVLEWSVEKPGLTASGLLRELVEAFVEDSPLQHQSGRQVKDPEVLVADISTAVRQALLKHGYDL